MSENISAKQKLIAAAVKRILRPIVKLMLANQLTYTFAIDLLKTLFVEIAEKDFALKGKAQTDSRISLISGVHRKDVRRLREYLPDIEEVVPQNVSLGSQIIAVWTTDAKYLGEDGLPKALARLAAHNVDSFESLVRSVSTDIHPRAVLDEWLRLGVATVDEENFVHLVSDAFIPNEGMEEMAYYLGHNLHDHAQAAVSNMQGQQPAFFERCVHYDELSIESVQQITKLSKKIGMKSLQEMYKTTDRIAKAQPADVKQNMRLTYGIYYYHEPMQSIKGKADDE
jgi:hypothetical protein